MSELIKLNHSDWLLGHCKDDPVRPHLQLAWRVQNGREVYALQNDDSLLDAVICVAYCTDVPANEQQLDDLSEVDADVAVFYTVWSYTQGAGRLMVNTAAEHIHLTKGCKRYVTLSPLTEMAERFHIKNGATLIAQHTLCQNFEYTL
jgi:hypothetical protein